MTKGTAWHGLGDLRGRRRRRFRQGLLRWGIVLDRVWAPRSCSCPVILPAPATSPVPITFTEGMEGLQRIL